MRTLRVLSFVPLAYVVLFMGYVLVFGQTLPWFDAIWWVHIVVGLFAVSLYARCLYLLFTAGCFSAQEKVVWLLLLTLLGPFAFPFFTQILLTRCAGTSIRTAPAR
ncbi:MAG: hypothetical protein IT365_28230 [Candidatus Hydrogenedentes bacterium]|nr:hypothetical protein [Candidatus Hydrogenedentota bacterium]